MKSEREVWDMRHRKEQQAQTLNYGNNVDKSGRTMSRIMKINFLFTILFLFLARTPCEAQWNENSSTYIWDDKQEVNFPHVYRIPYTVCPKKKNAHSHFAISRRYRIHIWTVLMHVYWRKFLFIEFKQAEK